MMKKSLDYSGCRCPQLWRGHWLAQAGDNKFTKQERHRDAVGVRLRVRSSVGRSARLSAQ